MNRLIIKRFDNIGWVNQTNFIDTNTFIPIKLKHYNGRLCFRVNGKIMGLKTWKKNCVDCKIEIINDCPF